MEQLLKLPQIRISLLQKIISQRKGRQGEQHKPSKSKLQHPLILGEKPFYMIDKSSNFRCLCTHMKCDCKSHRKQQISASKHKYLSRRKRDETQLIKCKTQTNQIQCQSFYKTNRNYKKKYQILSKTINTELLHKQIEKQIEQFYQKIQKQISSKLQKKYSELFKNPQLRQQIIRHLKNFYKNKLRGNKQNKFDIQNNQQLINKQIERFLKNKLNKQNKNKNKLTKTTNLKKESQKKEMKNLQNSYSNKKQKYKKDQQLSIPNFTQKQGQKKELKSKQQSLKYQNLISALIGKNNQQLTTQFFKNLVKVQIVEFKQKIQKIQQIIQQYKNVNRVKRTIIQNINKLNQMIQQSDIPYKNKQLKLKIINKILRFLDEDKNQLVQQTKNLYAMFKDRSRKTIKKTKTVKSFRNFEYEPQDEDLESEVSRRISKLSLADELQITQYCSKQNQNSLINVNKLSKRSSNRSSRISIRLHENINQFDQINQDGMIQNENVYNKTENVVSHTVKFTTQNETQQKMMDRKKKTVFDDNPNKIRKGRTERRLLNIQPIQMEQNKQQKESQYITNKQIDLAMTDQEKSSRFKREYENQVKIIQQKTNINKKLIEQFMAQNRKVVQKGALYLKKQKMEGYIIENTDTVLLKKKKLRKLKSMLATLKQSNKNEMVQQLLKYINCYQVQCKLILNMKKHEIRSQYIRTDYDAIGLQDLIDKNTIDQDLKFIRLSQDYHYGQEQDNQLDFMGPFNIIQQISYVKQPEKEFHEINKRLLHQRYQNYGNLIQSDLPYLGKLQSTISNKNEQIVPQIKQTNKQNKLYKRIRKYIEEKKQQTQKFIRSNKFLLTQNTMSMLSDTSRIRFSQG